jgi:cell division protein FtsI/penicillin-binding protein 2
MLARTDSRARALVLLVLISLVTAGIGARLVWWQVLDTGDLVAMAESQFKNTQPIVAERGEIFDRSGVLLATSVELQSVFALPPTVQKHDPAKAAELLASVLGLDRAEVYATLTSDLEWTWLRRRIDPTMAARLNALHLVGIGTLPEPKRVYPVEGVSPGTTMAAQVLGFVNVNGDGLAGV